jgi:ribosome biogenesis GTPase
MTEAADISGQVVDSHGRRAVVRLDDGSKLPTEVFGKRMSVVCGDLVTVRPARGGDVARIVSVRPRRTLLARTDSRGRTEELAANVDLMVVLIAAQPETDLFVVDRYLAGAAYASIAGMIVLNKSDLHPSPELAAAIGEYRAAGYSLIDASARTKTGVEELKQFIGRRIAILVGQSGVGKSTLTNALVPASAQLTRELSESTGEGRHTTVASAMLPMDQGGALIDSPGVRDYAPTPIADATVQVGWPEIVTRAPQCRFNDCLHLREPGCAVIEALESGGVSKRRYESYKRLLNVMRGLAPSYERR